MVHTGDIGYLDDSYLFIVDRAKDMIITGGFTVSSAEGEQAVLACPGIQDGAVIGLPDEKWGASSPPVDAGNGQVGPGPYRPGPSTCRSVERGDSLSDPRPALAAGGERFVERDGVESRLGAGGGSRDAIHARAGLWSSWTTWLHVCGALGASPSRRIFRRMVPVLLGPRHSNFTATSSR